MKRRYQIDQQRAVQQFRQLAREENPNIQMIFPMAEVVGLLQEGVRHLLREAGLALMNLVMEEEVRHLAGDNESLAYKPCSAPVPIFRHSSVIRISAFRQSPHHVPT